MNDSRSLGDTIRDRRLALGYSLGQLATKVNKTASSIRAWERGEAVPSDEESDELAAALDLDTALLAKLREPAKVWEPEDVDEVDVHDPWTGGDQAPDSNSAAKAAASQPTVETAPDEATLEGGGVAGAEDSAAEDSAADEVTTEDALTEEAPTEDAPVETPSAEEADEADAGDSTATGAMAIAEQETVGSRGDLSELFEAKTEAVPVVKGTSVAVAQPHADPLLAATAAQPVEVRSDNPVIAAWDDLKAIYYRIFDPRRRWIYRVRYVLLIIAFFFMLRVLAWAAGNLFDAIGEVLDSISFSPGETPDVEN